MRDERRSSGSSVALNAAICPDLSAASPVHSRPRTAASSRRRALVTASVLAAIALCLTAYVGTFEVSPLAFGCYCVGVCRLLTRIRSVSARPRWRQGGRSSPWLSRSRLRSRS